MSELPPDVEQLLTHVANRMGVSREHAIRRAIVLLDTAVEATEKGQTVTITDADGVHVMQIIGLLKKEVVT